MYKLSILSALMFSMFTLTARAQADSIGRSCSRMLGTGPVNILDTYLSPEKYKGTELRYVASVTKRTKWQYISQTLTHQGYLNVTHNRENNNNELGGAYNIQYILRYNWQLTSRLRVAAGGGLDALIGFLYNTRNSNNPAQARLALNIVPSVAARYDFSCRTWAFRLNYEASAPLAGVMFSPNYGQSYYEIFNKGNYDHNIVPTTIVCTPSLRQMFMLDFRPVRKWSRTWLRVGYIGDYQQAKVNGLKQHQYSHLFALGITKTF